MSGLSEFKIYLGDRARTMSEEYIETYHNLLDQVADISFDMWVEQMNNKDCLQEN